MIWPVYLHESNLENSYSNNNTLTILRRSMTIGARAITLLSTAAVVHVVQPRLKERKTLITEVYLKYKYFKRVCCEICML